MSVTSVKTLPAAVHAKMVLVVGTNKEQPSDIDSVEIIRRFLAKFPQFTPFYENCRWGQTAGGDLAFDQLPESPNTSLKSGWHVALAAEMGLALGLNPDITAGPVVTFS